jgi:hypothetical protein
VHALARVVVGTRRERRRRKAGRLEKALEWHVEVGGMKVNRSGPKYSRIENHRRTVNSAAVEVGERPKGADQARRSGLRKKGRWYRCLGEKKKEKEN